MEARHSLRVGIGREAGRERAGRGGGSRKMACETEECLYLWPRRWPTTFVRVMGDLERVVDWKLKGLSADGAGRKVPESRGE
jgi:hypothetical protein